MTRFEDHECGLEEREEEVVKHFIDSGIFIDFRRRFRKLFMINRRHPKTFQYFKSDTSCRIEETRHLVKNYYMIHPLSMFNLYWEFFMMILLAVNYVQIPLMSAFDTLAEKNQYWLIRLSTDLLFLTDIIKHFFTGYYDDENSKVVLNFSNITKRYMKRYLIIDILALTSIYYVEAVTLFFGIEIIYSLRILSRLRIFRLHRWTRAFKLYQQYIGFSNYLYKGIRVVCIFIAMLLWGYSIHFYFENTINSFIKDTKNERRELRKSFFTGTMLLLLVAIEDVTNGEVGAMDFVGVLFLLIFGLTLQIFLYAQVMQVWTKYVRKENEFISLQKQFYEYMTYMELPPHLRQRIFIYFDFKFHKNYIEDSEISSMVSPILKEEMLLHVTKNIIESVEFFQHLPEQVLLRVMAQMKRKIYLPGDVILNAGTVGTSMFFILDGTVAVYTPNGIEICHLEDGDHFGEIALIISGKRVATVVAISACEFFVLKRSNFLEVIAPFPKIKEDLMTLAIDRMNEEIEMETKDL